MPVLPTLPPDDADTRIHQGLAAALAGLGAAAWPLHRGPAGDLGERGDGHFHLVPELFLQLEGTTCFRFPGAVRVLQPGQALLLPPRLLHAEQVQPGEAGEPFANLVLQADGGQLSCHLAHEAAPGRPGIAHLVLRRDADAAAVQDWLSTAAQTGPAAAAPWADAQARALVCAALAATLRLLSQPAASGPAEPPLVARLRVLVQNQLGDPTLGVRSLAAQSGCTADHLSHVFRRWTGTHLVVHIAQQRMARAARLLRETRMPGKQVAWACGFASHSYFSAEFRRHHGCSPRAWRLAGGAPMIAD